LHRWGEIWHEGGDPRSPDSRQISPHRCNDKGIGLQKLKYLLRLDQHVEYKRPAGAYRLHDFHKISRVSTPFHGALDVKTSLDLLKGLWSYEGFKLTGSDYPPNFQSPPSGETMRQTPKSFRCARGPLAPCQVWLGSNFTRHRGGQKGRVFVLPFVKRFALCYRSVVCLSVCPVCLSVCL